MAIRQWHWPVAFSVACALHIGLAVLMVLKAEDPPAKGLGKGGLEIQLTQAGSRPAASAHTRNEIDEAARRAAGEAAPLVQADRAEKAVLPDSVAGDTQPQSAASPVPESAEATAPASAPQPEALADARPVAAPVAPTAAPPVPAASEQPPAEVSATALVERVEEAVQEAVAAPVRIETVQDSVSPRVIANANAVDVQPAAGPAGALPPPDALPPLEQVQEVAPGAATGISVVPQSGQAAPAEIAAPVAVATTAPAATHEATTANVPAATATVAEAVEAPAAPPEVPDAPSVGDLPVTRAGDDVNNAGAVGPDEIAKALATGSSDEVRARSGAGDGEDRRDALGGAKGEKNRYQSAIAATVNLNLEYPEKAREAELKGNGSIYAEIARDGTAIEYRIFQSTGYAVLDEAALEAFRASLPFDRMPDSITRNPLKLFISINFARHYE